MSKSDLQLFMALARAAEMENFNEQNIANTTWAFGTAGQLDAQLFMVVARAAERCLGNFNS